MGEACSAPSENVTNRHLVTCADREEECAVYSTPEGRINWKDDTMFENERRSLMDPLRNPR